MTRPILSFLEEFTPTPPPDDVLPIGADAAEEAAFAEAERIAELVEAARLQGFDEGRQQVELEAMQRSRAMDDEHAAALIAARADWAAREAAVLAGGLTSGLAAVETVLAEGLADALRPFIAPAVRHRMIADINQALVDLIAGGQGALIEIRGPADLIAAMSAAWTDRPAVVLTAAEGAEVIVQAADTTIRSQLQAWSDRFEAAFGDRI